MQTFLYETHQKLGAKIVDFAGWMMPLQYKGIIQEYNAVRHHVGIFDVSHMGRVIIRGEDAEEYVNYLSTNKIGTKNLGATYTVLCNPRGGSVDDCLIFREDKNHFFLITNASNRNEDLEHCLRHSKDFNVTIEDRYLGEGILAVQGPKADSLVSEVFPNASSIEPLHFLKVAHLGQEVILSRTGYTGSGGFELIANEKLIKELWNTFFKLGSKYQLEPAGLGARDILRLEMGYALYGHELSESIAPTESVARWAVKWDKGDFIGKASLLELEHSRKRRSEYGIILKDKGIAREKYPVFYKDQEIGYVTSGGYSPDLQKGIALILVQEKLKKGDNIQIQIRQMRVNAEIVKLPFYHTQEPGVYHEEIHGNP